jgi:hypothetical protein
METQKNYGLKLEPIKIGQDYVFGAFNSLPKIVLRHNGQWDNFLVTKEIQNVGNIETQACTVFGTLNCAETLIKRLYTKEENFSDRWLAYNAGVRRETGGSPHTVAENLRKLGCPFQSSWDINLSEDFYKTPPEKLMDEAKIDFPYAFSHEYVGTSITEIKNALKYSPLGCAVSAWYQRPDGIYYSPKGTTNNHWVMIYGYDDEKRAWKVFDSYDQYHKLYSFDAEISMAKRYLITKKLKEEERLDIISKILKYVAEALGLIQKQLPVIEKKTMDTPEPIKEVVMEEKKNS